MSKPIDERTLDRWRELASRSDCFMAQDAFKPGDIRQMIFEIDRLRDIENKLLAVFETVAERRDQRTK